MTPYPANVVRIKLIVIKIRPDTPFAICQTISFVIL